MKRIFFFLLLMVTSLIFISCGDKLSSINPGLYEIIFKIYRFISSLGMITNPLFDDERLTIVFLIEVDFIEARGDRT